MRKIFSQVKKRISAPDTGRAPADIPAHLRTPEQEEDGFCLIGLTVSERTAVGFNPHQSIYHSLAPPSYNQVTMGSSQGREPPVPDKENSTPVSSDPSHSPQAISPASVPSQPPPDYTSFMSAPVQAPTSEIPPPQTVYNDVPFQLAPSVGGVDMKRFDSYPQITAVNWSLYQYNFDLERNVTQAI